MAAEKHRTEKERRTVLFRLEVAGAVDPEWAAWFDADKVIRSGANTLLDLRVADQSELYGRLRRIHDLNLQLISVVRIDL